MKKDNSAHFELVKKKNKRIVRNFLRTNGEGSIATISQSVGLSYPTVSSLLKELEEADEALICEERSSAGGRPGIRYKLNETFCYALIIFFSDWILKGELYDMQGGKTGLCFSMKVSESIKVSDIISFVSEIKTSYNQLKIISLGIPGAVNGNCISYLPKFPGLEGNKLAEQLADELGLKVFIENDINAVAFSETERWKNFAHIVYIDEDSCFGVGIVLNGEVIRGYQGYAGEMEYLCKNITDCEEVFTSSMLALTCVLNLPDILVTGTFCTTENMERVKGKLALSLPDTRIPNIHIIDNMEGCYERGLLRHVMMYLSEID